MPLVTAPPPDPARLVVVALSGGVDSATAAALLVREGHRVVGMTMRLYDAAGTLAGRGRCCGPRDLDDARAVAEHLGIPHYVIDLESEFTASVVDDFVDTYLDGETPNPCVKCNQHIKFTPLLSRARAIGADALATGHYARIEPGPDGAPGLFRATDTDKDQSYFLFSMPTEALGAVWFPLGGLGKPAVRALAAELGLPNADKAESQEICFVPDGDHAGFVARAALARGRALPVAGEIVDERGVVLGHHPGVHRYTVGQHRGLGNLRGGPGKRWFVVALEPARGRVVVGLREAAMARRLVVDEVRWLGPRADGLAVQLRHRAAPLPARIVGENEARLVLELDGAPAIAAPGQAAVLYDGARVVAGGWVARPAVGQGRAAGAVV